MKNSLCFFSVFPFFLFFSFFDFFKSEIVFVFEHFRHGARSSAFIDNFQRDQYQIDWIGDGELTSIGMRMHYLLGVYIREKYSHIINNEMDSSDLHIYSTDLNRTILSAQSQLLGMFPPQKGEKLSEADLKILNKRTYNLPLDAVKEVESLNDISIPSKFPAFAINFFSRDKRPYLLYEYEQCNAVKDIKQKNYDNNKKLKNFMRKFKIKYKEKFIKYFKINDEKIFDNYYFLLGVTDHFISSYVHKRTKLHELEDIGINLEEFFDECIKFKIISIFEIDLGYEISIMSASPILRNLIEYMDKIIQIKINQNKKIKPIKSPKFVMYSGHDYLIAAIEVYLNKLYGISTHYPDFAANQFFELHKNDNKNNDTNLSEDDFFLQYFYDGKLALNISYIDFKDKVMGINWSIDKINRFCRVHTNSNIDYILHIVLVIAVLSISIKLIKEIDQNERK